MTKAKIAALCLSLIWAMVLVLPVGAGALEQDGHPAEDQDLVPVAGSVDRWQELAQESAAQVRRVVDSNYFLRDQVLWVVPGGSTDFDRSFYRMLQSSLAGEGLMVSMGEPRRIKIFHQVDLVRHQVPGPEHKPVCYPRVTLTNGSEKKECSEEDQTREEQVRARDRSTGLEAVVQVAMMDEDAILYAGTWYFPVHQEDAWLYRHLVRTNEPGLRRYSLDRVRE
ncbi:hypothetical protein [Desulfonatronovibrio hydrogenovorans]|uniref:hypothetical protein n=1 Tax=Desulfonatronovibrio hydrogenovorans TaxID=53245 RepID=UPI00123798F0|nr:hypothetical protein [Desulfonatronovibrio hydrogenovorans]